MKIVYFGTPAFAADILHYLVAHNISLAAIVTQPDRPQGRNLQLTASPVKARAHQLGLQIPILQPEKASQPQFLEELASLRADLFVVVAFGQILPQKLLDIPPLGCINVHTSLLPRYRGAAPMQRCLMNGDPETGVCVQKMVYQLDAGDLIDEAKLRVPEEMNLGELEQRLVELSQKLLLSVLHRFEQGVPKARPQDPARVTLAPKIKPDEMRLDWQWPAKRLHNLVRALAPRPGAWCWIEVHNERRRLKILRTAVSEKRGAPGELVAFQGGECLVAAGEGSLQLLQVQPEGKKAMSVGEWMRGFQTRPHFVVE